ncbi:MAG: outer membrane beta-barrel protein [Mariprofundus sp.]|nr:outer membrane beta-barrel protein [Mariprofundus sp.]
MKKILLMTTALLLTQANAAQAIEIEPYAGIGLGIFELEPGANKKTTIGGFGFVGANLHEYFATEFRVGTTGAEQREERTIVLSEEFQVNWFVSAFAKPKIEVADGFELYALAGFSTVNASHTPANSLIKTTKSSTGFSYGLGGTYRYNDRFTIGMEWARFSSKADLPTKNTSFSGLDVNGFTTTFAYNY